jgi:2-amino-4-hydroxy-6-hydroxymethyldihydropteridine diphosphokinase
VAGELPRPDLLRRAYMLGPLAEIAPALRHPVNGECIDALWGRFVAQHAPRYERLALDLAPAHPA